MTEAPDAGDSDTFGWTTYSPLAGGSTPWSSVTLSAADDLRLAELQRRVIEPVVGSVLRPAERGHIGFVLADPGELMVTLSTPSEMYRGWLGPIDQVFATDAAELAGRFASDLEDWVCETRFGWGEQRIARYSIPD